MTSEKTVSGHGILAVLAVSMLLMAAFMFYCVFSATQAPKSQWDQDYTDANNALIDFHRTQLFGVVPNSLFGDRLKSLQKGHPFAFKESHSYKPVRTQVAKLNGKNLIMARFSHPSEPDVSIGIYALAKRQLPKTTQLTHQGFLFYAYEKGMIGRLVATNFYNDFFVFGLGELPVERLATLTLDLTNIREKTSGGAGIETDRAQGESH
jgi:hypothetical protein